MGRFFSAILIFPVLLSVIFLVVIIDYQKKSDQEFSQLRLNHAMNHANDAAMWTLQHENTINAESGEGVVAGIASVNPSSCWTIYKHIIMNNFNISGSTFDHYVERSTPAVLLVTNNGYYAKVPLYPWVSEANEEKGGSAFSYNSSGTDLIKDVPKGYGWTRKIPFARNVLGSSPPKIVLDTINGKNMYELDYTSIPEGRDFPNLKITSDNHDVKAVRAQLISAMSSMINQRKDADITSDFFIPNALDEESEITYRADTFRGYSLMVAMQDFDPLSTGRAMSNFSISNTQLVRAKKIECRDDGKYYIVDYDTPTHSGTKKVVTSMYQAAALGYQPSYTIE